MPIAVIPALLAGGTLVPHAAGGLIVTGASGYVAGTYLSTTTIGIMIGGTTVATGGGAVLGASKLGILPKLFGTAGPSATVGIGTAVATPLLLPFLCATAIGSVFAVGYSIVEAERNMRRKEIIELIKSTPSGEEAQFTEEQAEFIYKYIFQLLVEGLSDIISKTLPEEAQFTEEEGIFFYKLFDDYLNKIATIQSEDTGKTTEVKSEFYPPENPIFGRMEPPENSPELKFPEEQMEHIQKFMDKYFELIKSTPPGEEIQIDEELSEITKKLYEFIRSSVFGKIVQASEGHIIIPSKNPVF